MNKIFYNFPLVVAILLIIGALIYYSSMLRMAIVNFTSNVKSTYYAVANEILNKIEKHTFQAKRIDELNKKLNSCMVTSYEYKIDAQKYDILKKELKLHKYKEISSQIVQPLGYAELGSFQKLWLEEFKGFDPKKIYGLLNNGNAVGIVVEKNSRPLMILAGDPECSFAVYVGKDKAPGIAFGLNAQTMIVKYIPEWIKIDVGDKVITSGLDHIFPIGIPVGEVLKTKKMQGFQNAQIHLYGDTLHPNFLHLVYPKEYN